MVEAPATFDFGPDAAASRRAAWIEVSGPTIAHNARVLAEWLHPDTRYMAVVKANGYGHGLVAAARAALEGGADALGVAMIEEGVALRDEGIAAPILVMGASLVEDIDAALAARLDVTVSDGDVLRAVSEAARRGGGCARVHLKVDTGMGRVGFAPEAFTAMIAQCSADPAIRLAGVATHVGWEDTDRIDEQVARFDALLASVDLPDGCLRHAGNSIVTARSTAGRFDMVRLGLLTYGILPTDLADSERGGALASLQPALTLKARITQVRDISAGKTISYGGTYTTNTAARVGVIPVGYADGYLRSLSNRAEVLVAGRRCPIRGAVCMDQIVVDLSSVPEATAGTGVVLLGADCGERITAAELADRAATIPYEIISCLGQRLPRLYAPPTA